MKKFSIVLIIMGIIIMLIPLIGQLYSQYNTDTLMAEFYNSDDITVPDSSDTSNPEEGYKQMEEAFEAEKNSQLTEESSISYSPASNVTPAAVSAPDKPKTAQKQSKSKPKSNQIILGIIKIDKIKVKSVIVEGVKNYNLSSGIGHIPGTSKIGQPGNCALAGHRSYTFGHFFNRLNELVVGDEILISTKKLDFKYKVYEILEVEPDDVSILKNSKDESTLTLITCTPIFIASHRLIIHARLEEQKENKK